MLVRRCLVCRSRQAARPREALLPNAFPRKGDGGRGERGPGLRMYQSCVVVTSLVACSSYEVLRCEATRGEGSRRRRRADEGIARCRNTARNRPGENLGTPESNLRARFGWVDAQSPVERPEEEQRISCRGKAFRAGENLIASRQWGGSSLGGPRRIGPTRTAKKRARYRTRIATGTSEARSSDDRGFGPTRPHGTCAIR